MVADDLTGAADTAIHFIPETGNFLMLDMTNELLPPVLSGAQGLALTTESRNLKPQEAACRVRLAANVLSTRSYGLIYKKMDSQLRGLPGFEVEILRRSLGFSCSFIAPAYPEQGRITQDAIHLVNGIAVAEREPGRDMVTWEGEASLPELIAAQTGVKISHIYQKEFDRGMDALCSRIERFMADGVRAITFDASGQSHLAMIARAGLRYFHNTLLAGSAGLALAASKELGIGSGRALCAVPRCHSLMFICGSATTILHRQASMLVSGVHCQEVVICSRHLTVQKCWDKLILNAVDAWLAGKDLLLRFSVEPMQVDPDKSTGMLSRLADLAKQLIEKRRPDGLFLSGGDTASAVLKKTGVKAVRLKAQAMSGMAWGHAVQGKLDSAVIITKSGAFGKEEDLIKLYGAWKKDSP